LNFTLQDTANSAFSASILKGIPKVSMPLKRGYLFITLKKDSNAIPGLSVNHCLPLRYHRSSGIELTDAFPVPNQFGSEADFSDIPFSVCNCRSEQADVQVHLFCHTLIAWKPFHSFFYQPDCESLTGTETLV
jgi:hypothetical protein